MNELSLSKTGADLIKSFESCAKATGSGTYQPYVCPGGVLTVGWGHTNAHGRQFAPQDVWTQAECDAEFSSDMKLFEIAVRRRVTVPLTQNQFDALLSFTYNCGEGNLANSTLLKLVNRADFEGAALEFHKWNLAKGKVSPGLVRRRASESLLFRGIPDRNHDGIPDDMPHAVEAHPSAIASAAGGSNRT